MAKKKFQIPKEFLAEEPAPVANVEPVLDARPVDAVPSFASPVRCRRCRSTQTKAYGKSRDGTIQYRKCLIPECGHRFPVPGTMI
jgi:hypothetical protein